MPFLVIISRITKTWLFYCHTRYFGSVHCFCGLKILILNGSGLQIQTNGSRTSAGSGDLWLRWIGEDLDWDEEEDKEDSIIDFSNKKIDIRSLIHERIDLEHEDLFKECRDLFTVLKNLPCNTQTDTIYAIEYSLEKGLSEAMYWSDNYVYTIIGTPAHEFRVYPYRYFGRWLVDMVEQWDMTALQRAQEDVGGSDECYAILRIVIDEGAIITFYKELHKHLSSPNQDWNELKKPLGGDYISQYDCSK